MYNDEIYFEYLARRCDETILNDETWKINNLKILQMEKRLTEMMNPEQLKVFKQHSDLLSEAIAHNNVVLYKQGAIDKK